MAIVAPAAALSVVVTADTMPAQASLGAMNERVATSHAMFGGMLTQIGSFVAGQVIFAVLARAVMEVETQIKDVVTQTNAWNDQLAQLNAVLISTHKVAGWTADDAIHLADSLSAVTKYSNTSVMSVENLLLTFTAIGKDVIPQATEAVLNMATKMNEDTKTAAIQLGKALQDPILGMTALRRVGVNFSAENKKMVEGWVAHGQKAKAVAFILNELNTEFGGSAKAAGQTLSGQLAILNNQFDIVKQTIGEAMTPVVIALVRNMVPLITGMAQDLPGALKTARDAIKATGDYIHWLTVDNMADLIPVTQQAQSVFKNDLMPAMTQVSEWAKRELIPAITSLVFWLAQNVVPVALAVTKVFLHDFLPVWMRLSDQLMNQVIPPLEQIIGPLLPALIPLAQGIGWVFANVVGPAISGIITILSTFLTFIARVVQAIDDLVHGKLNVMNAVTGITHAITDPLARIGIHVPGFAEGGLTPGGPVLVGERGPEIVTLPAGSRVHPNGTAPGGMGGMQMSTFIIELDGRVLAKSTMKHAPGVIRLATGARNF